MLTIYLNIETDIHITSNCSAKRFQTDDLVFLEGTFKRDGKQ